MLFSYIFVSCGYFIFLIFLIAKDRESSLKDPIHFKMAMLASILWPLVMPLSLLELKAKEKQKARDRDFAAMPKPVSMADGEIRYLKTIEQIEEPTKNSSSPAYGRS